MSGATEAVFDLLPASRDSLESISAQVRDIQHAFAGKTRRYMEAAVYDVVAIGLFLLKAEMQFLLRARPDTVSGRRQKRNEKGQMEAGEGFTQWLETEHPDINERTSRRYRNAARNVGLTSDHTLEDVDAMRVEKKLHERTLTDLYKVPALPGSPAEKEPEEAPADLAEQTQRDFFAILDQVLVLRDDTPADRYEANTTRLHATLEAYTGCKWIMLEEKPGLDTGRHGEAGPEGTKRKKKRAAAAAKRGKGKGK